jgi:two-component system, sensor histidine kinase PdtaS
VDFGSYLQDLCAGMEHALVHDERIQVRVDAEPLSLPVDTAIALGMVVNELVTNAVKYAYPPPGKGLVLVGLVSAGDTLHLSVRDFGCGLPESEEAPAGGGLGMKLTKSLITQVNGELSITGPPGAAFQITMPVR